MRRLRGRSGRGELPHHHVAAGLPVRRAQKRMSLVGFDVGGVDGRYGPKSEAAVKDLQHRFQITVDGVVGPQTWAVIDALEDEGPAS